MRIILLIFLCIITCFPLVSQSHLAVDIHHPVYKILEIAETQEKVYGTISGFHGFKDFDVLKNIELIGASHCTKHKDKIRARFPAQFKGIKTGEVIEIR